MLSLNPTEVYILVLQKGLNPNVSLIWVEEHVQSPTKLVPHFLSRAATKATLCLGDITNYRVLSQIFSFRRE